MKKILTQFYDRALINGVEGISWVKTQELDELNNIVHAEDAFFSRNTGSIDLADTIKILEKDKSKSEVWSQVMFIQAQNGEFEDLLKTSALALEYFPLNPLFYYFNGVSNSRLEIHDKAITSFKNGLDFIINNQELLIEINLSLADSYHETDQHELSDKHFEKVLSLEPENTIVLNNYAYYLSLRNSGRL